MTHLHVQQTTGIQYKRKNCIQDSSCAQIPCSNRNISHNCHWLRWGCAKAQDTTRTIDIIDCCIRDWKRITWMHSNWTFDCMHSALRGNGDLTHLAQFKTGCSCSLATLWMELLVFVDYLLFGQICFMRYFLIYTQKYKWQSCQNCQKCIFFRLRCTSGTLTDNFWYIFSLWQTSYC